MHTFRKQVHIMQKYEKLEKIGEGNVSKLCDFVNGR